MHDFIVVGGGLIGLLSARELALGGARVLVLERGAPGRESSWAGGGILSPLYPWRYPEPVNLLADWSQAHYPELCERLAAETGIDPEWTRSGMLMLGTAERDEAVAWAVGFDADLEYLDTGATRRCEPALGPSADGALWMPQVAQVRNPRLLQALAAELASLDVEVRPDTEVTGLSMDGERAAGVETAGGAIPAGAVVLASGAWTGRLLAQVRIGLAVEPVRGQMLLFTGPVGAVQRIVLDRGRYIIPRRDGRVLVGSTMERVGFDKSTTEEAREALTAAAVATIPALDGFTLERHWAGLRPSSPEGVPFIGEIEGKSGLYVNAGHFRNGVVMGLASGRLLADLALARAPCVDPGPYRPGAL